VIATAPESLRYGQAFSLRTPQAASIASVVLIRLGAYTHAANMEQRFVPLAFAPGDADTLDVTAPVDGNVAPPGYYLLFIVDRDGVPSVAPFVLLGPPASPAPRVPSPSTTTTTSLNTTSTSRTTTSTARSTTSTSRSTTSTSRSTTSTSRPTTSTSRTTSTTSSTSSTLPGAATTESRILASADDAEEQATGKIKLTSSTLDLVHDVDDQVVGLRFTRIDVPRGATIVSAWVQFRVQTVQTEPTSLVVQGQAADTAPAFTSAVRSVSSRPRTTAAVAWGPIVPWLATKQAGPDQRTPNLAAVLEEIVDRPGWVRGNAAALIITGHGHRGARSFDLDPAGAPLLHVEYLPAGIPTTSTSTSSTSSTTSSSTSSSSTTSTSSTSTTASTTSTSSTASTTSTTSTSSTEPEPTTSTSTTESTVDDSTTSTVPEP
jgi:hypothetical protein